MRIIEERIIESLRRMETKHLSQRDFVDFSTCKGIGYYNLWGHSILLIDYGQGLCYFCMHGYDTQTTKNRMNILLSELVDAFCGVFHKRGTLYLHYRGVDYPMDVEKMYVYDYNKKIWHNLS